MLFIIFVSVLKKNLLYLITYFLFFPEIGEFQKIVGTFIEMVDSVAKEVEKEKMKVCWPSILCM